MKRILLIAFVASMLPSRLVLADGTTNATDELNALIAKVNSDLQSGKTSEADLADDIKQYDVLLAEHKGEKTDAVAHILYMKAVLYSEVFNDTAKSDALIKQLTNDFAGTGFVAALEKREAQEAEQQQAQEAQAEKAQAELVEGRQFPNFNVQDVMGKPLSLADYKGKIVLIDFWATWCAPCLGQLPDVLTTYQKYHDKGFEIIGVSLDMDKQKLLNFVKQNNMTWQQYFDGQVWNNALAVRFGIEGIPATFLLDRDGKIIAKDLRGQELPDAVANALGSK